ncbi:hypothetical protein FRC98_11145 [Lujinxingia vulgaris]|uniref:Uncharacterized protein n=1 Tax=Lujinxingia vulgaris TaxID=2600176 RepID=A0A5C6X5X2_9DELT|nr:hypothetical protein [Lujinxingia vulgaris]TXD37279.1 hypothetical protein FRC98_11145 [Lujinxingia vulgaris]
MSETKFDMKLQAWLERSARRLGPVAARVEDSYAREALELAERLMLSKLGPYRLAVDQAQEANETSARAAEEVSKAQVAAEDAYARLHAASQAHYYTALSQGGAEREMLKRRLSRGMPQAPSAFTVLGVDRKRSVMSGALRYAEQTLGADHPVVAESRDSHEALSQALDNADNHKARAVKQTQRLFSSRECARLAYMAARQIVEAALSLDGDGSLSQLMPPISDVYAVRQIARAEVDEVEAQDEAEVVVAEPMIEPASPGDVVDA